MKPHTELYSPPPAEPGRHYVKIVRACDDPALNFLRIRNAKLWEQREDRERKKRK